MIKLILNNNTSESHFQRVKPLIINRIKAIDKAGSLRFNRKLYPVDSKVMAPLLKYMDEAVLKKLITITPDQLKKRVKSQDKNDFPNKNSLLYKLHYRVFVDYGYEKFEKLDLINDMGLDTCPYCNRNYIYALNKKGKIKPQIDHFYPKSKYPLLAACFYNLVPCCQTCNGIEAKGQTDPHKTKIKNPYLLNTGEFQFSYALNLLPSINPLSDKSKVNIKFSKSLKSHIDVFKLDQLYEKHSDHVLELIIKKRLKYSQSYRKYLNSYKGLQLSDGEIDRIILGNYFDEVDLHKRPLSILYRDIAKQLGLI